MVHKVGYLMKSRVVSVLVVAVLVSTPLIGVHVAPPVIGARAAGSNFVTRSNRQLMLNGAPFRFTGFNIFNANGDALQPCWGPVDVNAELSAIGSAGNVFRAWFAQSMVMNATHRTPDWSTFDATLAAAVAHNQHVIAVLSDRWGTCDPPTYSATPPTNPGKSYSAWYQNDYKLVMPNDALSYRDWVSLIVSRYASHPEILFWQMQNEPGISGIPVDQNNSILGTWANDIGWLIKNTDPNHLVSLGNENIPLYGASAFDVIEYHDYNSQTDEFPFDLAKHVLAAAGANKPIFVGEVGLKRSIAGSLQTRAGQVEDKVGAMLTNGIAGVLPWNWVHSQQQADDWSYWAGDPALSPMASWLTNASSMNPVPPYSYSVWLAACRSDIVAAYAQARWRDILFQYIQEIQPAWWNRSDIAAQRAQGHWDSVGGEWFIENDSEYWNRPDIVAAWNAGNQSAVYGEYIKETGFSC